ncbi:ribosome recycling factor [Dissulfurirhabdus thermomarina]|uniref:Ribosome-recycling factor n=1 Tax=Dissulfurirhabdus thermomarina TaxID=1765737 RepID=A0A6N9TQ08_DISTH|nr:ribosome recycling factor [Dissulfurirhabdus thermomarina]NDY43128.1 ribosome recycling factor [Dissulfurirhabdus thermomarina]NMX23567.1 ribosome recycling factor [Dissulfurirhabdus thermomarina]
MKDEVLSDSERRMEKATSAFEKDLAKVRTGRATPALLEGIAVDYYGSSMPINQVASVSVPESRLLVVQPWDVNVLGEIEKAILRSELGLTPNNDGKVIRVSVPPLTEERRKDLVKLVRKMAEEARVAVRNIRRDAIERLKRRKKEKEISEDDMFRLQDEIQKLTDAFVKRVDEILAAKEKEILEF